MDEKFKVRVTVAQWPTRSPVYHKPDGLRFAHPNTLKVRANQKYVVEAIITPAKTLTGMRIWGQTLFMTPVHERHHRDIARYSAIWCTSGYDVNKNKTRTFVPVMMEFKGEAVLLATVQCKVYPGDGDGGHYQWGQTLHSIDLDCKALTDGAYVDLISEKFVSSRTL
ncbi:hypothetical protein V1264_019286 [Littorina saxatilis]|uniref:CB1 cannabinoid receptor-interacting protein 1 n=2 Tax=Littorina saxatilis TaxID=31220 RepID=A0AAN9BED1_9CAEN